MKKIVNIALVISFLFAYTGCLDLDENPKGLMAPEGFFKTVSDVEAAINGAHAEWVHVNIEKEFFLALMLRSDMVDIGDRTTDAVRVALNDFDMDAQNSIISKSWDRLYMSISAANTAIQAARSIDAGEDIKNELEAKARFIRAYTYFHLVRCLGDVPYMDTPVQSADEVTGMQRTPESEIYEYIIEDFIFAKTHLSGKPSEARNYGTKGSAATALAEVYLTLKRHSEAATEARFVISNEKEFNYGLAADYQDLFNGNVVATLNEPMFIYELNSGLNEGSYNQTDGMVNLTRIRDLSARSLSVNVPSLAVYNSWDAKDYRRKVSFEDSVTVNGVRTALVDMNIRVPRPHIAKFFRYPGPHTSGDDRSSDYHYSLYRYADVLLIAAEAIVESEGATTEAIGYVNRIRKRARFNGTIETDFPADVGASVSDADFIKIVREERRLEFAFEFKRWYDIKRWGIMEEAFTSAESLEPHTVDTSRDYLFPIPQDEVDVAGLSQNHGY